MLQSIVLKNFVHFMDRTVIALNNSQKGQTEGHPINAEADKTTTDSKSPDRERGQKEKPSINTGADKTPTENKSLDRVRVQTKGPSSSTGAYKTPTDSKALDIAQEKQAEGQLTNTGAVSTPRDRKSLDRERGQSVGPSTSIDADKRPTDSKSLDRERGQTEGQSTSTDANKTPTDSESLDKERRQTERPSTSTTADKTPTGSKSLDKERGQTEGPSSRTGAHKTPTDSKALDISQEKRAEGQSTNTGADSTPRASKALDSTDSKYLDRERGQTERKSTSTTADKTPTDSKSLDKEGGQTEGPSTSTTADKTPTESKSLDRERGQTEGPSSSTGAHKTPTDSKASDISQEKQAERQSTNTGANSTPRDSKSLDNTGSKSLDIEKGHIGRLSTSTNTDKRPTDSKYLEKERGQPEGSSTSTDADKTPTDSEYLDRESGQTEGPSTSTTADKTPTDSKSEGPSTSSGADSTSRNRKSLDRERGQTKGPSTSTGADKTSTDSKSLDRERGQTEGPSTSTGADKTQMDSKSPDEKTTTIDSNALNIFVGANFCGKSTVLELIRRCMTDEINVSVTRPYDETMVAYAFCQFHLPEHGEVISGIIRDPGMEKMFKVFIYKNRTLVRSKSSDSKTTRSFSFEEQDGEEVFKSIFNKTSDEICDEKVKDILGKINRSTEESSSIAPNWKSLEDKFIATFPLRGIGSVQWTRSKRIVEKYKESNYEMASERAEIISTLLSPENDKILFNENEETRIFNFLTYPEVFKFEKVDDQIKVQHNGSQFDLLKTSEGIIEAKVVSLLLAHNDIKTLCLEDPDRGMHPQMIERLKTVLYDRAHHKTIVVVTHSPYFIDSLTIHRTHVFIRNQLYEPYVCSVLNVGDNTDLSRVTDIETIRILLFATKVLLVEGPTDREVVQTILTRDKCIELEKSGRSENNEEVNKDFFTKNISTHQIIPIGGCDNVDRVQAFCDYINLPCVCLLDRDKVKMHFKQKGKFWGKRKDKNHIEELEKDLSINRPEKLDDYIEALKSRRKKTRNPKTYRPLSEIISFMLKEKRDEDLKKYIVSLESKFGRDCLKLRYEPFETYLQSFQSKTNCQTQQKQEKEHLKTISMFWLERKEEEEFDSYIDSLNNKYSGKNSFNFWEKNSKECEDYLTKLESNRKTFVWRNGELEDAILSSDDYDKIFNLLTSTDQDTIEDMPSGSKKGTGKGKQTKGKKSQRSKVTEQLLERLNENTIEQLYYFWGSTARNESKNTEATGGESSEKGIDKNTKTKDEMSQRSKAAEKQLGENIIEQFLNYLDTTAQNESENTAFGGESSEKGIGKNAKTKDKMSQRKDDLKQKLTERLDEYTRQQFCNYLMEIKEIRNFISFMAKEKTKPEESQPRESFTFDDADCSQAGSCATCFL